MYRILSRYDEGIDVPRRTRKSVATKMPTKIDKSLWTFFNHKQGRSRRKAASKFGIRQSYVKKLLKSNQYGDVIKCRKKQVIPDRSEVHIKLAKTKCRKLSEKFSRHDWVLDDESYFTLDHSSIVGNDIFYTNDIKKVPANVRFTKKAKYPQN